MKIRIICNSKTKSSLAFVKALKEFSGYGLKEAKDCADSLHANGEVNFDYHGSSSDISQFRKFINELPDGSYIVNGGVEVERERKLLSMGLGTQNEYIDFLSGVNATVDTIEVLRLALSYLPNETLAEIVGLIDIK